MPADVPVDKVTINVQVPGAVATSVRAIGAAGILGAEDTTERSEALAILAKCPLERAFALEFMIPGDKVRRERLAWHSTLDLARPGDRSTGRYHRIHRIGSFFAIAR